MGEIIEQRDGDCITVTIANERRLNALTVSMWKQLKAAFDVYGRDERLRCVVITGDGVTAFSAGADISEFETSRATYEQVVDFHENIVGPCLNAIAASPCPVVAAVRGACMGGGLEIATVCDIRIADSTSRFGAPVGQMGFPLAFAETRLLFQLVGPATAAELLMQGRIFTAQEALESRIVSRVAEPDHFQGLLDQILRGILKSDNQAARSHKRQLRRLLADQSPITQEERFAEYAFAGSEEYQQGFRRFLQRKLDKERLDGRQQLDA